MLRAVCGFLRKPELPMENARALTGGKSGRCVVLDHFGAHAAFKRRTTSGWPAADKRWRLPQRNYEGHDMRAALPGRGKGMTRERAGAGPGCLAQELPPLELGEREGGSLSHKDGLGPAAEAWRRSRRRLSNTGRGSGLEE